MTGPILHLGASVNCTHGAAMQVAPGSARVLVDNKPAATMADSFPVAGCPFQIPIGTGTKPSPCLRIQWTVPATRVTVNGSPVITMVSTGLGLSPESAPQGPPIPASAQTRVIAQ